MFNWRPQEETRKVNKSMRRTTLSQEQLQNSFQILINNFSRLFLFIYTQVPHEGRVRVPGVVSGPDV